MKRFFLRVLIPWSVTVVALYFAFRDVEWGLLVHHLSTVNPLFLVAAIALTSLSYVLRSIRWPLLFPKTTLSFKNSYKVLVLGFFMNNVLPARAGELVRAHMGGKVSGEKRTLVLATIASERLADGLTLSLLFVGTILFLGTGQLDPEYARNLLYVAYLFLAVTAGVVLVLLTRRWLFALAEKIQDRLNHRASTYTLSRIQIFIEGLSPLCQLSRLPMIVFYSVIIWGVELLVFICVAKAFLTPLSLSASALFLVAVNFSSLIPAAPGGFGVIELVAKKVLLSVGVASDELALSMVLAQHVIQYAVVGIPGAIILATWRSRLKEMEQESSEE